ncbi:hypothetical protein CI1B_53380 [Bradyrhizobium ivorense]|uniref:Uncharacterized protein n=1 Tax=Bradyrhizobium ivorense TaxID=2511166 RepID=A0A508TJU0_9BRAD|nr:hypothetical protein CI1B_53380 [Bradyrhizobium ivorense]
MQFFCVTLGIRFYRDNAPYAGGHYVFGAEVTWKGRAVQSRSSNRHSVSGRICYRRHFGMDITSELYQVHYLNQL